MTEKGQGLDSGCPMLAFVPGPEISEAKFVFLTTLHQCWKGEDYRTSQSASCLQICWYQLVLQILAAHMRQPYVIFVCSYVCFLCVTSPTQRAVSVEDRMPDIPWMLHTGSRFCLWTQPRTSIEWKNTDSVQTKHAEWSSTWIEGRLTFGYHWISDVFLQLWEIWSCNLLTLFQLIGYIFEKNAHAFIPRHSRTLLSGKEELPQTQWEMLYNFRDAMNLWSCEIACEIK